MDDNQFIANFKEALEMENDQPVNWSDEFREYDDWDSLGLMSLIAMMEENYGVTIEQQDFENLKTVQDLFDEVKKRSNSN